MAYMSAREMLSGLPVKRAEGGPVHMANGGGIGDLSEGMGFNLDLSGFEAKIAAQAAAAQAAQAAQVQAAAAQTAAAQAAAAAVTLADQQAAAAAQAVADQQAAAAAAAAAQAAAAAAAPAAAAPAAAPDTLAAMAAKAQADYEKLVPIGPGDPLFDALQNASNLSLAPKTYGNFGATAKDIQNAAVNVRAQIADGSYDPAAGYAEIMKSGISVDDAIDAGIEPSLIDAIFTTPTALVGDQLSSQGQTSVIGSGTAFANALTKESVDAALAKYMLDGEIDPVERLEMQKVATAQGVTFEDISSFGIDPNILFNIPETGGAAAAAGGGAPAAAGGGAPAAAAGGAGGAAAAGGGVPVAATTKVCPKGTVLEGQIIGINESCGIVPKTDDGGLPFGGKVGETPAEKAARIAAAEAARLAASIAAFDNTQAAYTAPTVYQPLPDNTGVFNPVETSLDTTFRESAPQTEVLDQAGNVVGLDYTTAADLLSATGSGFSWTPPTVTSRPRSLMGTDQINRLNQGRAAADLRQLSFQPGLSAAENEARYNSYAGLLDNPGSYSGGLSRSQIYARQQAEDFRRGALPPVVDDIGNSGTVQEYLAMFPDIGESFTSQKASGTLPANMTLNQFARDHYAKFGIDEMANDLRRQFTLLPQDAADVVPGLPGTAVPGDLAKFVTPAGVPDPYTTNSNNWNLTDGQLAEGMFGDVGPIYKAHGGSVKKPQGFADGGTASADLTNEELQAQLIALDAQAAPAERPLDQEQTESSKMFDSLTSTPFTKEGDRSIFGNVLSGVSGAVEGAIDYGKDVVTAPSPSAKMLADAMGVGYQMKQSAKEDPIAYLANTFPPSAQILALNDLEDVNKQINEARKNGNKEEVKRLETAATTIAIGAFPFMRGGVRPNVTSGQGPLKITGPETTSKNMLDELSGKSVTDPLALEAPAPRPEAPAPTLAPEVGEALKMLDEVDAASVATNVETAVGAVSPVEVLLDAKGHALPPILLTRGTGEKPVIPVVQAFTPNNKVQVQSNIDTVIANNPESLTSPDRWLAAEAQAFGGDYLPSPPSEAINYNQTPSALAAKLDGLTPQLKATVDEGFRYVNEIKNLYNSRVATPDLTGRMFLWGILSRGAGPVQQESAFLDLVSKAEPYIAKSVNGEFTDADLVSWKQMVSESLPEGSPAKQVTMNANAAGTLLKALSEKSDNGQSALKSLHNDLADPKVSGPKFRRKFFELTNKPGIDNKVVSFIGLVSGKDDLLVMDRIQSRHLWDDGRYEGKNIYDGINKGGLSKILGGPRGLMVTEMLENGLKDSAKKAYEMIGRPQDGSLGRMHWETWLIEGNQGVSHSTLQSVRSGSPIGFGVTEGKPGTFSSGMTYRQAINGSLVEYPLSEGNVVRMTPERQKEFLTFVKAPKNGIVPKDFKVSESVSGPWYERSEVNRGKLDDAARQFENANPDGSLRSGDVRPYAGGDTLSERRRQFLRSFRADQNRTTAATRVVQGVNNGGRAQETPGPYSRGAVEGYGGDGLLSFSPEPNVLTQYQSAGLSLPVIKQVEAVANAPAYFVEMTNAMAGNRLGAQVEIKSTEDLSTYRLFRTESGSGFAIKPDGDVVAVFASPNEPAKGSFAMLQAAAQAGGTKLDAFDTFLPEIYEAAGFRPVARLPWNDEFAPPNWDKAAFAKYNKGEPDVVFFVHDPEYYGGAKNVPVVKDYDQAIELQDKALGISNAPAAQRALPKVDPSLPKYEGMRDATVQHLKNKGIMSDEEYRVAELDGYVEDPKFTYSIDDSGSNSSYITLKKTTDYDEKYGVLESDEYTIRFSDHSLPKQYAYDQNIYNVSEDYYDETINGKTLNDAINYVDRLLPNTPVAQQGDINTILNISDDERNLWQKKKKKNLNRPDGWTREPNKDLMLAAQNLGKIQPTTSKAMMEYAQEVQRISPIKLITQVPELVSFKDIANTLDKKLHKKGIIGINRTIEEGENVGARLHIPGYNAFNTWIVTVHKGTGQSGPVLGYGQLAVLDNVTFSSSPEAAYGIAATNKGKSTFARMNGKWRNVDPEVTVEEAKTYLKESLEADTNWNQVGTEIPNWIQVGMNPDKHSYFYNKSTGQPLGSANKIIQIGQLVLARGAVTRDLLADEHKLIEDKAKKGVKPTHFKKGGAIERVYNNPRYI